MNNVILLRETIRETLKGRIKLFALFCAERCGTYDRLIVRLAAARRKVQLARGAAEVFRHFFARRSQLFVCKLPRCVQA